jgi:hypothetical protein
MGSKTEDSSGPSRADFQEDVGVPSTGLSPIHPILAAYQKSASNKVGPQTERPLSGGLTGLRNRPTCATALPAWCCCG